MNIFLTLCIFCFGLLGNLAAEHEVAQIFHDAAQKELSDSDEKDDDSTPTLSELLKLEQIIYQSISKKLELVRVYRDFVDRQNRCMISFSIDLEKNKNEDGKIDKNQLIKLAEQARFPRIIEMRPFLEKLKTEPFVGYKIESILELIFKDDSTAIQNWFVLLEDEISAEITNYEKSGIPLDHYSYILDIYKEPQKQQAVIAGMFFLMNKECLKN